MIGPATKGLLLLPEVVVQIIDPIYTGLQVIEYPLSDKAANTDPHEPCAAAATQVMR
jgi:hypothetical protein